MAKKVRYDDYPEKDELRRSSFTGFSARFPGDKEKSPLTRELREKRQKSMLTALAVTGCFGIIFVGFFVTMVLLSVSRQDPAQTKPSTPQKTELPVETQTEKPSEAQLKKIRALTAPQAALGGGSSLESFIKNAKDDGFNSAVFVLKAADGSVFFPSALAQAQKGDILNNSYADAKKSIAAAKKAGLSVIVRVSCFRDSTAPAVLPDAAVRYSGDERLLWLDDYADRGGKPWLNPFSKDAQNYLLGIIREAAAMNPDAIYLTGVQFPSGTQSFAAFPGENKAGASTRNAQLLDFIKDAKKAAGGLALMCEMDAQAALQPAGATIYGGDLWYADADVLVIPVSNAAEAKLLRSAAPDGVRWIAQSKDALSNNAEGIQNQDP